MHRGLTRWLVAPPVLLASLTTSRPAATAGRVWPLPTTVSRHHTPRTGQGRQHRQIAAVAWLPSTHHPWDWSATTAGRELVGICRPGPPSQCSVGLVRLFPVPPTLGAGPLAVAVEPGGGRWGISPSHPAGCWKAGPGVGL
jgi:hypothetical protein